MSDLIERQKALDGLKYEMKYGAEMDSYGLDTAYDIIENIPSAEPERKKGKWIEDETGYGYWTCSACGFVTEASAANILYHFCPNCGSEMTR